VKVAFLGTAEFACPSLDAVARSHDVRLVVTQPDRPAGRGERLRAPPVKELAADLGLRTAQPLKVSSEEGLLLLREAEPDVIVVAAYGQILRRPVFALPPLGTINLHASLLPRHRGAAPINWAIIHGDAETGVTTFFIEEGLDMGRILLQRSIPIGSDETAGELHDRLAVLGAELVVETLKEIEEGTAAALPQDETKATLAPKLEREDGQIDWARAARQIHDQVRGMNPWPGAFTRLGRERLKVHRTGIIGVRRGAFQPGAIALAETGRLLVATSDELIELLEVQKESRPRTSGRDLLNGLRPFPERLG
jgi:methionyl-tRNA formyltransferase